MIAPIQQALSPFGATLSDTWAAVIGDRVAAWRLKNAASLQLKVNDEVGKLGLQLDRSKIPERYAFAWFEEATKQDEPEIQELFARLLARAAAGDQAAADRRHLEILTHFTPMDAVVLEWFFEGYPQSPTYPSMDEYEAWKEVKQKFGDDAVQSLEHLVTLGVLDRHFGLKRDGYHQGTVDVTASASAGRTSRITCNEGSASLPS